MEKGERGTASASPAGRGYIHAAGCLHLSAVFLVLPGTTLVCCCSPDHFPRNSHMFPPDFVPL